MRLSVRDRAGLLSELQVKPGDALMPVLRDAVDLSIGTCGGVISCGTCLILVGEAWSSRLPAASADELEMLAALDADAGARLACQLVLSDALDGLEITVAAEA